MTDLFFCLNTTLYTMAVWFNTYIHTTVISPRSLQLRVSNYIMQHFQNTLHSFMINHTTVCMCLKFCSLNCAPSWEPLLLHQHPAPAAAKWEESEPWEEFWSGAGFTALLFTLDFHNLWTYSCKRTIPNKKSIKKKAEAAESYKTVALKSVFNLIQGTFPLTIFSCTAAIASWQQIIPLHQHQQETSCV